VSLLALPAYVQVCFVAEGADSVGGFGIVGAVSLETAPVSLDLVGALDAMGAISGELSVGAFLALIAGGVIDVSVGAFFAEGSGGEGEQSDLAEGAFFGAGASSLVVEPPSGAGFAVAV